jgi:hypothetical protein
MNDEQKQREAFYLIKKYSSYTWYAEIYRVYRQFCEGYERDFYRHPVTAPVTSFLAGTVYTPGEWDESNLSMFWGYADEMEQGLAMLKNGDKSRGYQLLNSGGRFNEWLFTRRFEEIDLSDFGYRRYKCDGVSKGVFADAERARSMALADAIDRHTDELRRDFIALDYKWMIEFDEPNAKALKIPFGVPPGELPPLPAFDGAAPTVMSGDEVPAAGIWVVEPDAAHVGQTYCMAYLRTWAPALTTVSEQEYETNTRRWRTGDEAYRKDSDKIKDYPVRWRLLWRDERDYSNGNVPPEEADYLIYREPTELPIIDFIGLRIEAGQACPQAGYWFAPAKLDSRHFFSQGEIMPSFDSSTYGATIWQWSDDQSAA